MSPTTPRDDDGLPDQLAWDVDECPVCGDPHWGVELNRSPPIELDDLPKPATHWYQCPAQEEVALVLLALYRTDVDSGAVEEEPWTEDPDAWKP